MDSLHVRKPLVILTTITASALCLGQPAFAQSPDRDRPTGEMQEKQEKQDQKKAPKIALAAHNRLIGAKVDNGLKAEAAAELGSVSDLVIHSDGTIEAVVIRTGTTLGLGGTEIEYPWKSLTWSPDLATCSVELTQEQFARLPKFDRRAAEASGLRRARDTSENEKASEKAIAPMLASQWADLPLRTAREDFGAPDNLIIETRSGTVAFATASIGGVLGIGDRTILIPWTATKLVRGVDDDADPHLMLGVGRDTIGDAPVLENPKKQLDKAEYRRKVYEHFQVDAPAFEDNAREKGEMDAKADKKSDKKAEKDAKSGDREHKKSAAERKRDDMHRVRRG